ncbi:hypothetical protein ACPC54_36940 [Kitasatospora sp. NPDC094028]
MTKKLDTSTITNELEGSVFFSRRPEPNTRPAMPPSEQAHSHPADRPGPQAEARPPIEHRAIRQRHKFDIYEDQYDALRQIAEEQRGPNGQPGSMSAMVREALDVYLRDRKASSQTRI